jgi:hypothetical protein
VLSTLNNDFAGCGAAETKKGGVNLHNHPNQQRKTKNTMKKKQSLMVAFAGAALLAAPHARAQVSYTDGDLLLNFRESVDSAGTDATVDLGNVNTFLSSVSALSGHTAVLDSGAGYGTSAYTPQFSGNTLITKVGNSVGNSDGTADNIGFSAAAENLGATGVAANTVWLTRQISASQLATGGSISAQQGAAAQNGTALAIQGIGFGAESAAANPGIGAGTAFSGSINGALVPDGNANSYHSLAQDPGNASLIDYGSYQNPSHPGTIEATAGSGTIYEALWEVPQNGNGLDTYEGYFTLQQNGQLSFTSAVPEPSTYALLVVTGVLALAMRRQIRAA